MINPLYPNPSVEQSNGDDYYRCPICNQANVSITYYGPKAKGWWGLSPACGGHLILICATCGWKGVSWDGEYRKSGKRLVKTCERRSRNPIRWFDVVLSFCLGFAGSIFFPQAKVWQLVVAVCCIMTIHLAVKTRRS